MAVEAIDIYGNSAVKAVGVLVYEPIFITANPVVEVFGPNSVKITWTTDRPSTSEVDYGRTGVYGISRRLIEFGHKKRCGHSPPAW